MYRLADSCNELLDGARWACTGTGGESEKQETEYAQDYQTGELE